MANSFIHLLAGGPGSDRRHLAGLLRVALESSGLRAPRVAYIGAASGDDAGFFHRLAALLQAAGAGDVFLVPTCRRTASCMAEALAPADAIFVSGGDVDAGMQALQAANAVPLLRKKFQTGVPFIGLSAGSIMLGREWIAWDDPGDDATARLFPCLGFAPLVCDTHSEDDDWAELRALLARAPSGTVGYGITAPAMLRIHADGRLETLGGEVIALHQTIEHSQYQ